MEDSRLNSLIQAFRSKRILVIGDLMLDEFIWGNVSRISPEAPVPVVDVIKESSFPGGAANVARNLREFSDDVRIIAQAGLDAAGDRLADLLQTGGIRLEGLLRHRQIPTIVKTRIIARHQQVVRVDRERKAQLSDEHQNALVQYFSRVLPEMDGVIFEDYGKGLITQALVDRLIPLASTLGKVVMVDPNPNNRIAWRSITCATPNRSEAFACAGINYVEPAPIPLQDEALLQVGNTLLEKWSATMMLVTLGEHGMMLFRRAEAPFHIPTRAKDVFDVSGAGDTAIALLTLSLTSGASPVEAADIANHASGVVVGKLGTATVTPDELLASFKQRAE